MERCVSVGRIPEVVRVGDDLGPEQVHLRCAYVLCCGTGLSRNVDLENNS